MPKRFIPFSDGNIYHVYDKTVESIRIFSNDTISTRFINTLTYYRSLKSTMRYSYLKSCRYGIADQIMKKVVDEGSFRIQILAYCLMPNHYHLLVRQLHPNSIEDTMIKTLISITRLYNTIHDRKDPVFLTQFKAKRIRSEEQLLFVSRYIHVNPYTSGLIKKINGIYSYRFSSINAYMGKIIHIK